MDTVAEFLTRIRNAGMAGNEKVDVPSSNMRKGIAQILKDHDYIRAFHVVDDGKQGMMRLYLKYNHEGSHAIEKLQRVSRPSRRYYVSSKDIPKVRNGYGISIFSTSRGVMSGDEAKKNNVGGEYLCRVW